MKPTDPMSMTGALKEITEALGIDLCASHVGKTTSLLYKWGDPDHEATPSIEQAFSLERLYVSIKGCEPKHAPISSVWNRMLQMHVSELDHAPFEILQIVLSLPSAIGNLSDQFSEAIDDGVITSREKKELKSAVAAARKRLDALEQSFSEDKTIDWKSGGTLT